MLDFAKLVHDAIGIENPRIFVAVFALFGLLFFGGVGWLLDAGYRAKTENPSARSTPADSGPASFGVKDLSEFGGLSMDGYKIIAFSADHGIPRPSTTINNRLATRAAAFQATLRFIGSTRGFRPFLRRIISGRLSIPAFAPKVEGSADAMT
jgi:hypothetical protein